MNNPAILEMVVSIIVQHRILIRTSMAIRDEEEDAKASCKLLRSEHNKRGTEWCGCKYMQERIMHAATELLFRAARN